MNRHEEDLQGKVERNEPVNTNDLDANSYRIVFRALKKEPEMTLSSPFEERIIRLMIEKRLREERRDRFWFGFGIALILIAFIVAIVLTGFAFDFGFLKDMADYKGLAVFAVIFIALLNWVDKKFITREVKF
jgi:hypothetical protein